MRINRNTKYLIIIGSLIVTVKLFNGMVCLAQDYKKDMTKIAEVYRSADKYIMKTTYKLFKNHETPEVMETGETLLKKRGSNFYSKNFSLETIVNSKYVISLDHDSKVLMIDLSRKGQDLISTRPIMIEHDSIIAELKKVFKDMSPLVNRTDYIKLESSKAAYTVQYNYGEYQKISFVFNTKTYIVDKVILYYRKPIQFVNNAPATKPRIEVVYEKFDTKPSFSKTDFSEINYLRVKPNNELIVNTEYEDYAVINHLIQ